MHQVMKNILWSELDSYYLNYLDMSQTNKPHRQTHRYISKHWMYTYSKYKMIFLLL